jgi:hypothetical protein
MTRRLSRSCIPVLLGLLSLALLGSAPARDEKESETAALRAYTSWSEITHGPYKVSPAVSTLCMPPLPQAVHPGDVDPGGADPFIRVYANAEAAPLLRSHGSEKRYPVGAMIAKAKLLQGKDAPVSVAFMVKRKAGFNPASLDWEFLFFDGQMKRQVSAGSGCQGCHGNRKETDGVFGSYLPDTRPE